MLTLQNCHNYTLWIFPDTFANLRENATIWTQGNETNFIYQDSDYGPNRVDISEAITMDMTDDKFSLNWDENFICKPLDLQIFQMPYLYKNHSENLDTLISDVQDYKSGQVLVLNPILPCMTHRYELYSESDLIFSQEFKTEENDEEIVKLQDREIYVKADTNDYEVLTIEWADRCIETYRLDICQFPYDCSTEKESFHYRTFQVSSNR